MTLQHYEADVTPCTYIYAIAIQSDFVECVWKLMLGLQMVSLHVLHCEPNAARKPTNILTN